jgi:hypothetical protein
MLVGACREVHQGPRHLRARHHKGVGTLASACNLTLELALMRRIHDSPA